MSCIAQACRVCQCALPVHRFAAVLFHPHQASGTVGDGAVAVVYEVVDSVSGVSADVADKVGRRLTSRSPIPRIALDAPIGEELDVGVRPSPEPTRVERLQ